jgi:fermentation-respiration switch protein FrsA (DUF1100 family)
VAAASVRARVRLRQPIERVAEISPRGLLLVAPQEDRLVSWTQSREMYQRAREPKELFVVPGAAHSEAREVAGFEYERRVLGFLDRHLDGRRAAERAGRASGGEDAATSVHPGAATV